MSNILDSTVDAEAVELQVLRGGASGGSYNADGEWVKGVETPETFFATIHPGASTKALRDLEEGVRKEAKYTLWTRTAIVIDEIVVYGGVKHRVMISKYRPEGGFYRVIIGLTKQ